ncbi:hypothetical protein K443DRAFT_677982 [Laccaria amethystina LaAM-08-1]|uniref:Uncharacterized protein n=1 Tax=Laccaria amethystina LaAM-08-1 TaxID=1095629 RepID=A0A0C9XWM1_9AGAR|nr:hypothetical protein K443DRAFT_677982 [Laccaria amethystina LaAM-08-1]
MKKRAGKEGTNAPSPTHRHSRLTSPSYSQATPPKPFVDRRTRLSLNNIRLFPQPPLLRTQAPLSHGAPKHRFPLVSLST